MFLPGSAVNCMRLVAGFEPPNFELRVSLSAYSTTYGGTDGHLKSSKKPTVTLCDMQPGARWEPSLCAGLSLSLVLFSRLTR